MPHDPAERYRRSVRLAGYDYASSGAYIVTICTQSRACLLGDVRDGKMRPNDIGEVVREEWLRSATIRPEITLDAFVVMPNHAHGIVVIRDVGAHGHAPLPTAGLRRPARSLGAFVAAFKGAATRRINRMRGTPGVPVWQRNYYEHVIRDNAGLDRLRRYILDNPARWAEDPENPAGDHRGSPLRPGAGG
jgi:REP element-mobilizing transposase RayT